MNDTTKFLNQTVELARANVDEGSEPYGPSMAALHAQWAKRGSGRQG